MSNNDTNAHQAIEIPRRDHGNKPLVQQVFHKGLFNTAQRTRSNSTGSIQKAISQEINNENSPISETNMFQLETQTPNQPSNMCLSSVTPGSLDNIPWQRVPGPNQKRNRSPELITTTHKLQKRSAGKQNLFNKNSPKEIGTATIDTSNSFSLLTEDHTAVTKPKKISKPPPIILYGIEDVKQLTDFIQEAVRKEDYSYKIISKNRLSLSSKSVESYKILIEHIRNKGLIGHTFTRKEDRCQKFVIKNLHHSTPKEAIVEAIEATGNRVRGEIVNARKKHTKEPYNIFFVNIEPNENLPLIKSIEYIYHQSVKIEDPRRNKTIVQCTRCQQYGHTKNYCMRPFRCVKCGGPHNTTTCTKDKNSPAICALCQGSHPANYKGCQVYREIYARKAHTRYRNENNISEPKQIKSTILDRKKWMPNIQETQQLPQTTHIDGKSYRDALIDYTKEKSKQRMEHTNVESSEHQSTQSIQNDSHTHNKHGDNMLLEIIKKQAQKIDLLIQQMGTLINLMTSLISKY
jgi:hypothetical protein